MNINYAGQTPETYNCWLATRPVITPSQVVTDKYQVPGRRGELVGVTENEGRTNAFITFTLHQKAGVFGLTYVNLNAALEWLRMKQPDFYMTNDPDFKYEVLGTNVNSYVSKDDKYARVEVQLEVYPFKFRRTPTVTNRTISPSSSAAISLNTDICEPSYQFTCTSSSGTITVNGKPFTVYQGTNVGIDVRNQMCSEENLVEGDYKALRLWNGNNTIATSSGVTLKIVNSNDGYIV